MEKKNKNKEIEEKILGILKSGILMSITKITKELEKRYNLRISPQVIKRYLLKLEREGKIIRKNG